MSTSLHSIEGKYEVPINASRKSEYEDAQLHIAKFYGGTNRGTCFQITIGNGLHLTFIQLTAEQYYKLVAEMHNH
jgi:hypothetical protein